MSGHAVTTILLAGVGLAVLIGAGYVARFLRRPRPEPAEPAVPPRPPAVIHADVTDVPAFDRSYRIGPPPDREGGENR